MPLRYLLDEDQRGVLWPVIQRYNARGIDPLDAVRVGDVDVLPLGTKDPEILLWAEVQDRILVTFDKSTMAGHLADHLAGGHHCPGIFMMPRSLRRVWRSTSLRKPTPVCPTGVGYAKSPTGRSPHVLEPGFVSALGAYPFQIMQASGNE